MFKISSAKSLPFCLGEDELFQRSRNRKPDILQLKLWNPFLGGKYISNSDVYSQGSNWHVIGSPSDLEPNRRKTVQWLPSSLYVPLGLNELIILRRKGIDIQIISPGPVCFLWLSKVSANEIRHYICNVCCHWPQWAIDRKWALWSDDVTMDVDEMRWDEMRWDRMGLDEMGWDEMGWDEIGWD